MSGFPCEEILIAWYINKSILVLSHYGAIRLSANRENNVSFSKSREQNPGE